MKCCFVPRDASGSWVCEHGMRYEQVHGGEWIDDETLDLLAESYIEEWTTPGSMTFRSGPAWGAARDRALKMYVELFGVEYEEPGDAGTS